jgi:ribonuclease HI
MHTLGLCKFRLESRGPNNEEVPLTSNRADLRAVIAALRFWLWNNEGTRRLVIATDSSYVIDGATERVKN